MRPPRVWRGRAAAQHLDLRLRVAAARVAAPADGVAADRRVLRAHDAAARVGRRRRVGARRVVRRVARVAARQPAGDRLWRDGAVDGDPRDVDERHGARRPPPRAAARGRHRGVAALLLVAPLRRRTVGPVWRRRARAAHAADGRRLAVHAAPQRDRVPAGEVAARGAHDRRRLLAPGAVLLGRPLLRQRVARVHRLLPDARPPALLQLHAGSDAGARNSGAILAQFWRNSAQLFRPATSLPSRSAASAPSASRSATRS